MQTPRQVYDQLRKEGYRVQYYRLPLTDGEAPKETIFDVFYNHVKDVPSSDALIFNCQMGGGRTTTGMVIGCLIRMHTSGHPHPACYPQSSTAVVHGTNHLRIECWLLHMHAHLRSHSRFLIVPVEHSLCIK